MYQPAIDDTRGSGSGLFAPKKKKFDWKSALLAAAGGDEVHKSIMTRKAAAAKQEAEFDEARRIYSAVRGKGGSHEDGLIAAANPAKFSENYSTRWGRYSLDEGSTGVTPELDGSLSTYTAPKTFQNDADVIQSPGQVSRVQLGGAQVSSAGDVGRNNWYTGEEFGGGVPSLPMQPHLPSQPGAVAGTGAPRFGGDVAARRITGLRTDTQQYADDFGKPGSDEWKAAAQDWRLRGSGPTAYIFRDRLQDQRLASGERNTDVRARTSERNNIRTTSTSRGNNIRTNDTSRANTRLRSDTSRQNTRDRNDTTRGSYSYQNGGGRGGRAAVATATGPNGEKITFDPKKGAWVDAQGRVIR